MVLLERTGELQLVITIVRRYPIVDPDNYRESNGRIAELISSLYCTTDRPRGLYRNLFSLNHFTDCFFQV